MDALRQWFDAAQTRLFEAVVQPVLYAVGGMRYIEDAYAATEWFLLGAVQVAALYAVLRPLESMYPAERWSDRRGVGVDVIYTLLHRLGAFALLMFFAMTPLVDRVAQGLRSIGYTPLQLDALWPGMTDVPVVSFALYLVVLDFTDYWLHRAQHRFRWWWALHALHHSQRKMSFWTDSRNHLLDSFIVDGVKALVALAIGVAPAQFVGLIVATRVLQSVQHANVRWTLGPLQRVLVGPVFHRRHHAIGIGHEGRRYGCNFAVLFPMWDQWFGTADYRDAIEPTGVRDQLDPPAGSGRDYGRGFWAQQWLGLRRLFDVSA
jgi:sterol desaturase/sphingolipid hydroxylase (fatty acid hydroxylase superfamily)